MATYYRWRKSEFSYVLNQTQHQLSTNDSSTAYSVYAGSVLKYTSTPVSGTGPVDVSGWSTRELTSSRYVLGNGYKAFAFVSNTNVTSVTDYFDVSSGTYIGIERSGSRNIISMKAQTVRNAPLYIYTVTENIGDFVEYVYSTSSTAYPNGGVSGDYYYDQRTTVTSPTAPSGLTYPNPITTPTVTVSWSAAASNVPGYSVNQYEVSYSTNGTSWTVAGTTAGTSLAVPIPAGATSITFRVRARDSNNQWGSYVTGVAATVILAPTLTVPQMVMQGQQAAISWTAVEGADSYTVQRKSSADADWTQVYSGSATTFSETVGTWTSLQYRVQAVFGETSGGWATSASIPVVSASALGISGSDGDLGTLVNDIPYSISTDTGNAITATISVNGAVIFSGSMGNSAAGAIPVLDLVNGTGTIVIEASVQATSGAVSAVRTWTYTKAPITFPNAGGVAQLTQEGANIWPKTLAECVRLPGGKTLDEVTALPVANIETGSYVGTNLYNSNNPNTLTFSGKPIVVFIQNLKLIDASSTVTWRPGLMVIDCVNQHAIGLFINSSLNNGAVSTASPIVSNCVVSVNNNTVSWYSTASEIAQFNEAVDSDTQNPYGYVALVMGGDTE